MVYNMADRSNVGEGWQPILEALAEGLRQIAPGYEVLQIKEKFGGLRYYVAFPGGLNSEQLDKAQNLINFAEMLSFRVCEECGKPGRLQGTGGWMRTLCDGDEKRRSEIRAERLKKWAEK